MQRVVVFGGSGFIGQNLCLFLSERGFKVVCLSRSNPFTDLEQIEFHSIDFYNTDTWKDFILEGDLVVNLVPMYLSRNDQPFNEDIHLSAIEELAKESKEKKIKNLLYLSSGGSIYGRANKAFEETDSANPISLYGKFKLKSEQLLLSYQEQSGLPLSIARPSNIYGGRRGKAATSSVITAFFNRILSGAPIEVFGDLQISKDYLHIDDLVIGLSLILEKSTTGIYNLGFGKNYTLMEIIQEIEVLLNKKAEIHIKPLGETDIHTYSLNCRKSQIELGFRPKIDLKEGLFRYNQDNS